MNFDLSKEQQLIVDSVAKFAREDSPVERFRRLRDSERGWEPETWRRMGEYGWLGVAMPERLGGTDGTFLDAALIIEQLGRSLVPEPYLASVVLAGSLLERLGSAEQHESVLRPMIDGEISLALAYAERQSRHHPADCATTATAGSGGYRLLGEKVWVQNGHAADFLVVSARTAGGRRERDGISLFLVPATAAGVGRTVVNGMDGRRTAFVRLDGTPLPETALLGGEGAGYAALAWALDRGAAAVCAEGQGLLHELFARTVLYLKQREQFGAKIGSFQALQHRAADMFAEVELCRGMMLLAALRADEADTALREAEISAAKVQLTHGGWLVQENAIQLHGGIAITDEHDIGLFFKRLRVLQALFGDADYHLERFQGGPAARPGSRQATAG